MNYFSGIYMWWFHNRQETNMNIVKYTGPSNLKYAHEGDAAVDLCSAENLVLAPKDFKTIQTNTRMKLPVNTFGRICPRSGLARSHGIDVLAGVIDSNYRGDIQVILINHGNEPLEITQGMRIAQLVIQRYERCVFQRVSEVENDTSRGEGGFGSTGI